MTTFINWSTSSTLRFLLLIFITCHSFSLSHALLNITIDDTSSYIHFEPQESWTRIIDQSGTLDAGGSHMITDDPNAFALVTIAFTSVYVLAPSWPYAVSSQVTVGDATLLVDLQDHTVRDLGVGSSAPPTVQSHPVARIVNSNYSTQTIRISVPPGGKFAVFDMLIIQIPDNQLIPDGLATTSVVSGSTATAISVATSDPSTTSSTASGTTTPKLKHAADGDGSETPSSRQDYGLLIAIAVMVPTILILSGLLFWKCYTLRKRKRSRMKHLIDIDSSHTLNSAKEFPHYTPDPQESPYVPVSSTPASPWNGAPSPHDNPRIYLSPQPQPSPQPSWSAGHEGMPSIAHPYARDRIPNSKPIKQEKTANLQVLNPPRFTMLSGVMTLSSPPSYVSALDGVASSSRTFSDIPPVPPLPALIRQKS
ncbi:hypothetical protein CPB83DRAFT_851628 [Crepidotus variabilis]|uniref:Uncharacterized protein n=1 Tax=Crepidotus variabilis TaxID=179855 RepID=A0A9P6JRJ7_9AGAR|nr:hypothetical protein CPB83DRAFT_851628 [Crepidotus variabilis]